jgi:hypothetical protein
MVDGPFMSVDEWAMIRVALMVTMPWVPNKLSSLLSAFSQCQCDQSTLTGSRVLHLEEESCPKTTLCMNLSRKTGCLYSKITSLHEKDCSTVHKVHQAIVPNVSLLSSAHALIRD